MAKIDKFKKFVSNHPEFVDYVRNNKVTWQSFYELYDIYGEDMSVWNKYIKDDIKDSINIKGILNTLKTINLDSLEENIGSLQKAVSLVEELTRDTKKDEKEVEAKEEKIDTFFGDDK
ncbi:MAG: YlbD family protein [Tenericutes bacterium]|nr:YlbD family protein [Mycoplasmatota bacterium]